MKENQRRHFEGLHGNGKPGVKGLTGRYHNTFFVDGVPRISPKQVTEEAKRHVFHRANKHASRSG